MKVTKHFSFDAAHQLVGHFGKCANLHGHTYKVEVSLTGEAVSEGSSKGMVIDFYHVKQLAGSLIDRFDHAFLIEGVEPAFTSGSIDTKRVIFNFRTTAENMAKFLTWSLANLLQPYARLDSVKLWETPTGCAECDYYEIFTSEEIEAFKKVIFIDGDEIVQLGDLINA